MGADRYQLEPWHPAAAGWFLLGLALLLARYDQLHLGAAIGVWLVVPLLAATPFAARPHPSQLRRLGWLYAAWVGVALLAFALVEVANRLPYPEDRLLLGVGGCLVYLEGALTLLVVVSAAGIGLSVWRAPRAGLGVEIARAILVPLFPAGTLAVMVALLTSGAVEERVLTPPPMLIPAWAAAGGSVMLLASILAFWGRASRPS